MWLNDESRNDWPGVVFAAGFTAGILLPWAAFSRGNRTRCPRWPTARSRRDESVFICHSCEVAWKTNWTIGG